MNKRFLFLPLIVALAGCGQQSGGNASQPAAAAGPREIDITANDMMKFSLASIQAKPGEQLRVVLTNVGTQPKEVMGHDWILLKAGTDANAFSQAGIMHKETGYIAPETNGQVLAKIGLLGPRQSGEVVFTAPSVPGDYTFLCTFPAHFQAGMKGTLSVR